jgi:tRNA (guanine-N7-)-methyltransferase
MPVDKSCLDSVPPADAPRNADPGHRRGIRSFVLRTGRATAAQQRALSELWPKYGVEFAAQPLDLDQLFGRSAPRLLEIGFGTGEALHSFAQIHPEMDCLGVEVHPPGVGRLLLELQASEISNCRVIAHDAVEVLRQQLPAASLALIHIFFPDPWPKKRHHKRRLIQPEFAESLVRALVPGGSVHLATDWEPYAQHMSTVLAATAGLRTLADSGEYVERPAVRPVTRFERRGTRLGHGVWDLAYTRIS